MELILMVTLELSLFIIVSFGIQAISLPSSKEKDKEGNVRADFFLPSILVARCRNTACFYFSYSSLLSLVLAIASCKAGTVILAYSLTVSESYYYCTQESECCCFNQSLFKKPKI